MEDKDKKLIKQLNEISDHGNNAEVKKDKNGEWVVYEVHKKKKVG